MQSKIEDWLIRYAIFWWSSITVGGGTEDTIRTITKNCRLLFESDLRGKLQGKTLFFTLIENKH